MTDKKISELTAAAALAGTEEIPVVQSAATVKSTPAAIRTYLLEQANTFTALQTASLEDAGTTTVLFPAKLTRTSSGTPANGIGVGMQFEVETSVGNNEIGATIAAVTTDVTAASEEFALQFQTMDSGAAAVTAGHIGRYNAVGTYGCLWLGNSAPTTTNMAIYSNHTETRINANSIIDAYLGATWLYRSSSNAGGSGINMSSGYGYKWAAGTTATYTADTGLSRNAAGVVEVNNGAAGVYRDLIVRARNIGAAEAAATSCTKKIISIASIADATATDVFTVTIPNAAHSASVEVALTGSLGAGGAIGANEATGTIKYLVSVARTAGVNAVATISTAFGSATSAVAGAATITVAGDLGAITGAVGASNTFTIRVTITKGSGASANHTCRATAEIINANATGISIA